jgi:hypothetical protein
MECPQNVIFSWVVRVRDKVNLEGACGTAFDAPIEGPVAQGECANFVRLVITRLGAF